MQERPHYVSRFAFAIGGILLLLGCLLALLYESYRSYDANNELTLHTQEVQGALHAMRADLYRSESLVRAYYLSERMVYLELGRDSMNAATERLERIRQLTSDNPNQRARIPQLRAAFDRRVAARDRTLEAMSRGGVDAVRARYRVTVPSLDEADALIRTMASEEQRLFAQRRAKSDASAKRLIVVLGALITFGLLGLAVLGRRLFRELARRASNELSLRNAARFAEAHGKALTLFNTGRERQEVFDGLGSIVASELSMPMSAFYAADPFSDDLVLVASRAASAELPKRHSTGSGVIGTVATRGAAIVLPATNAEFAFDVGIARITPAAVVACPVSTHERCWGVMVVASLEAISPVLLQALERLCAQLAIALENIERIERQRLLSEQLTARGEEIARKNAELENANRLKSEFLATMSHELRTPLNAVIGFSESLRDEIVGPVLPEQKEFLGIIFDAGQHLLSLINDVLDLSKIEAGHMELEPETIDTQSLITNSVSVMKERAMRARVTLQATHDAAVASFVGDARKIKQVVYNLLSNAVKFTPELGTVTLHIGLVSGEALATRMRSLTRALPVAVEDEYVEIRVTDTGIGISTSDLSRLFRPFIQLEGALTRRHGGTGLGLALVDRLVELHGGAVGVSSELGAGSTFSVFLPRGEASGRELRSVRTAPEPASASPQTALVIEDDVRAQRLIRAQLEEAGITVFVADTAEVGLEYLVVHAPDVIILDLLLPSMDGWTFLDEVHKSARLSRIPVVITSVVADQNRGISLGAFRVLQKPVSKEALLEAIDAISKETNGGTVLVVDDDPQAAKLVAQKLERRFSQVLRAYSGGEAITIARDRRPDLIVLDLMMPDKSGFEVVEILKARRDTAQIPVAILTAKSLTPQERAKLSTHVEVIMQKSEFNHGRFMNEVRRAMLPQAQP